MNIENKRISNLRKKVSLSREGFSEKADFSVDLLAKIEAGSLSVSLKTATKVANAFGVSLDWIYGRTEDTNDHASTMMLYLDKLFHFHIDGKKEYPYSLQVGKPIMDFLDGYHQAIELYNSGVIPEAAFIPWVNKLKEDMNSALDGDFEEIEFCLVPKRVVADKDAPKVTFDWAAPLGSGRG